MYANISGQVKTGPVRAALNYLFLPRRLFEAIHMDQTFNYIITVAVLWPSSGILIGRKSKLITEYFRLLNIL